MSISSQISRLSQNISDSLTAVANKGVTVPAGSNSDDLPGLIAQISSGGAFSVVDTTDSHGGIIRTITGGIQISGTKSITENGTNIDVTNYAAVDVAVPTGADCPTFTVTVNSSSAIQSVTCDKTYAECIGYLENDVCEAIVVLTNGTDTTSYGASYIPGSDVQYAMTGTGDVVNLIVEINSGGTVTGTMNPIPYRDSSDVSASNLTVTVPYGYYESNATKTLSDNNLSAGNIKKDVSIFGVTGSYEGSSKSTQVVQGTTRTNASTLTAIGSELTVSKTGTYDIYYTCMRTNTSSSYTWGTQLYKNGTAYGSESTTWSNNVQNTHLTNVSLTANDKLRVYGRETRGTSYYVYAPMITIVEQ